VIYPKLLQNLYSFQGNWCINFPILLVLSRGSLIEPTAVALQAISLLSIFGGEKMIIFGASPIGLMAVNAAKFYGAKEITLVLHRYDKLKV